MLKSLAVLLALLCALPASAVELPNKVLWAWKRPEDLSYIDSKEFGIAYLFCHARLRGDETRLEWRNQPLKAPRDAAMVPVMRIDTDLRAPCAYSQRQIKTLVAAITSVAQLPRVAQIQIDFDATQTERRFYATLLEALRAALPKDLPLSITSLASWCMFDDWTFSLPVQESVPMMFSLGRDREKVLNYFRWRRDFRAPRCCNSLGLSLEEPDVNELMIPITERRTIPVRVYVFTKSAWTAKKVDAVRKMLGKL
jgi:hypothetical protein